MYVSPSSLLNPERLTLIDSMNAAAIVAVDVADTKADAAVMKAAVAADIKAEEMARTVTSSAMI